MISELELKSWGHLTGQMEEASETGVSHLVTTLVEVISKLAGSSYLVEQLMPALMHAHC